MSADRIDVVVVKPVHGAPKPRNVPADMVGTSPVACKFSVGDRVLYTNDYGAQFERTVRGFCREVTSWGAFVYLDLDCWWSPVRPAAIARIGGAADVLAVIAIDFEEFAAQRGFCFHDFGDAGMHKTSRHVSASSKKNALRRMMERDLDSLNARASLHGEYLAAVDRGEIRPRTRLERAAYLAENGDPNLASTQAAIRIIAKHALPFEGAA